MPFNDLTCPSVRALREGANPKKESLDVAWSEGKRVSEDSTHHPADDYERKCETCGKLYSPTEMDEPYCPKCLSKHLDDIEKRHVKESLTLTDIQRVYDETGDIAETELLCNVGRLTINGQGQVIAAVQQ